jgi:nucleoid-associated protein YgaU
VAAPDPNSRYARQSTIAVVAADGSARVLSAPRVVRAPTTRGAYTVRAGDRLDLLAHIAAGDSTRWWLLADANPHRDATRLEQPGETIELPDA